MSQTTKNVSIFTGIVVPALVAIATIVLFFIFKPEEPTWHLFLFNMLYTVFLELVFFGWIGYLYLGEKDGTSQVFKITTGVAALYYIIIGAFFMLLYNMGLRRIPLAARYYYIAIFVITLLWVVVGSILLRTDVHDTEREKEKSNHSKEIANIISQMKTLASRFSTLQSLHGAKGENAVDLLFAEFKGLTPKDAENRVSFNKLNNIIEELDQLMDEAESVPEEGYVEAAGRIKLYAKKTIGRVEQIKLNH